MNATRAACNRHAPMPHTRKPRCATECCVLQAEVQKLAGMSGGFCHFDEVVRSLCTSPQMQEHLESIQASLCQLGSGDMQDCARSRAESDGRFVAKSRDMHSSCLCLCITSQNGLILVPGTCTRESTAGGCACSLP